MPAQETKQQSQLRTALDELSRLRRFNGPPAQFWPAFMAAAGNLAGACHGLLILRDPAHPDRLKKLSRDENRSPAMLSAWGSTETSPLATSVHFHMERPGVIGLPVAGCELKLVPSAGKLEVRVRGVEHHVEVAEEVAAQRLVLTDAVGGGVELRLQPATPTTPATPIPTTNTNTSEPILIPVFLPTRGPKYVRVPQQT